MKTTAVYLAPKGNLLIFYKTEDGTIKETVTETFEILLPNMNLPWLINLITSEMIKRIQILWQDFNNANQVNRCNLMYIWTFILHNLCSIDYDLNWILVFHPRFKEEKWRWRTLWRLLQSNSPERTFHLHEIKRWCPISCAK